VAADLDVAVGACSDDDAAAAESRFTGLDLDLDDDEPIRYQFFHENVRGNSNV
jgi:hypothetical protein